MPITPIEIATMAPKSQAVTPVQQHNMQKPVHEQIHLNQQFNQEIRHNSQQTVKTIKSDNNEYRYDAKEKGNNTQSYSNKGNKGKNKGQNQSKTKRLTNPASSIDIRI